MEQVRPAESSDGADLRRLLAEARAAAGSERGGELWLRTGAGGPLDEPDVAALLADPDRLVLVGTVHDAVVSVAAAHREVLPDGAALAVIDGLYTEAPGRELGLGEQMVEEVLAWARRLGCIGVDAVALPGDRATKNLFERCGLVARAITVHRSLAQDGTGRG